MINQTSVQSDMHDLVDACAVANVEKIDNEIAALDEDLKLAGWYHETIAVTRATLIQLRKFRKQVNTNVNG